MEEKMKEQEPVKENGTEEKIKMSTGRKLVVSLIAVPSTAMEFIIFPDISCRELR